MNERCPPKGFRRRNTWPPVGAAVWGGLGGKGLTEKVALTLRVFRSASFPRLQVCSLFVLAVEDVSSLLPVPVAMPDACCASPALRVSFFPSGIISQSKLSSPLTLLLVMVSDHSNYTHQSLRTMWETLAGQVQRSVGKKNIFKKPLY